jgi:hypothetical protein
MVQQVTSNRKMKGSGMIKEEFGTSKGDLFIDELIRNGFNATRAALVVFDLKGETEEARYQTAASIGHTYLNKVEIQEKIKARMANKELSPEWLMTQLKRHAENEDTPTHSMQAIDRLAHVMSIELKPKENTKQASAPVQISLNLPQAPQGQALSAPKVVDADIIG